VTVCCKASAILYDKEFLMAAVTHRRFKLSRIADVHMRARSTSENIKYLNTI